MCSRGISRWKHQYKDECYEMTEEQKNCMMTHEHSIFFLFQEQIPSIGKSSFAFIVPNIDKYIFSVQLWKAFFFLNNSFFPKKAKNDLTNC